MLEYPNYFADNLWVTASGDPFDVVNPATEDVIAIVTGASVEDVANAARAASRAFPGWAATDLSVRVALLSKVRDILARDGDRLAAQVTDEMGMPLHQSQFAQVGWVMSALTDAIDSSEAALSPDAVGSSSILRSPAGPAACIAPWNFPVHQLIGKVADALLAGCTVVAKASELAPISPFMLASAFLEAGAPPGVFNLVAGAADTGRALVEDPSIRVISFTGSTAAGVDVAVRAAATMKRTSLELGGKSACVVLDADIIEAATRATLRDCFFNSGQVCTALTRLIVPRTSLGTVAALAREHLAGIVVGDPRVESTTIGPLVSAAQRAKVAAHIDAARRDGLEVLTSGTGPDRGYYVPATVVVDVPPDHPLATEEIFGPVLAVIGYGAEEDPVALANEAPYGLAGRVWASDPHVAAAAARRVEAGQVGVNDSPFDGLAPFGGVKMSGIGRVHGRFGIQEFTNVLAVPRT